MTPERLFHYQGFNEAHLASLLSTGRLKLSRPDRFNDPWDCRVHYQVPTEPADIDRVMAYLTDLHRKRYPKINETRRAIMAYNVRNNLKEKFEEMEKEMYVRLCNQYRVYCLSEKADVPLMWAHYAQSHSGICLEFDGRADPFRAAEGVQYRATYPASDLVTVGYEPLVTKSADWCYEAEWRLIAEERANAQSSKTIKTDNDFLRVPVGTLKSVTIGCLADKAIRRVVDRLVNENAPSVVVRQAAIATDRYRLSITPPF